MPVFVIIILEQFALMTDTQAWMGTFELTQKSGLSILVISSLYNYTKCKVIQVQVIGINVWDFILVVDWTSWNVYM